MANLWSPRNISRGAARFKRKFLYGINKPKPRPARAQATTARVTYGASRTTRTTRLGQGKNTWAKRAQAAKTALRSKVYGTPETRTTAIAKRRSVGSYPVTYSPREGPQYPATRRLEQQGAEMPGGNLELQEAYGTAPQQPQGDTYQDAQNVLRQGNAGAIYDMYKKVGYGGMMHQPQAQGAYGAAPQNVFTAGYGDPQAGGVMPAPGAEIRLPDGRSAQDTFFSWIKQLTAASNMTPQQIQEYVMAQLKRMLGM